MAKKKDKIQSVSPSEDQNSNIQPKPISIDELQSLKFENMKLKIDMLNINKSSIEKEINNLSMTINNEILQYMEKMNIPNQYRLDFSTMKFIVVQK